MSALVEAIGLSKSFQRGGMFTRTVAVQAVKGVDLALSRGESVGVVGESGSGKSTLGRLMLGLIPPSAGETRFEGRSLAEMSSTEWRALRRRMQIVFQDPYGSLDPRRTIGAQIADGFTIHGVTSRSERAERVCALLSRVGLEPAHASRFPHEFSGGQRQRIGIARALGPQPDFLVADEPVSALDVSIQAQIVELLGELGRDLGLTLLFISHDLPVVRSICGRVVVMYLGRVVEEGPTKTVFERPAHPYTRALLSATPRISKAARPARILLQGDPPSPSNPPSGCVFRTRCAHAAGACAETVPPLEVISAERKVSCLRWRELG